MSYDIDYLNKEGECFDLDDKFSEGGTQVLGGNSETSLNVTYNYSWYYYMFLDEELGIRWLYKKTGKECKERLEKAIEPFKDANTYKDYWACTPGNCVSPLKRLLSWCEMFPDGVFDGD